MSLPIITIEGYLTEQKLAHVLQQLLPDDWQGTQIAGMGTRHRWDMSCRLSGIVTVIEYDGDEHYRHSIKVRADRMKDAIARSSGFRVIRFPYWVQLDDITLEHLFGITAHIDQSFPHGFITTKLFPASFCELGIARFRTELFSLPCAVRLAVVTSLRERTTEYGREFVVPSALNDLLDSPLANP